MADVPAACASSLAKRKIGATISRLFTRELRQRLARRGGEPMEAEDQSAGCCEVVGGHADGQNGSWWKPYPLTWCFITLVAIDTLLLALLRRVSTSGNDAAGNGMAAAFRDAFVAGGAILLGLLVLLFVIVRQTVMRIALMMILVLSNLLLPMLFQ